MTPNQKYYLIYGTIFVLSIISGILLGVWLGRIVSGV